MVFKLLEFKADQIRKPVATIHDAAFYGSYEEFEFFIRSGGDAHACEFGWSLLHYAALRDDLRFARYLIESSVDANVRDEANCTPLHCAAFTGNVAMIRFLIAAGADLHAKDERGETPLHFATQKARTRAVAVLVSMGADMWRKDFNGVSPIEFASKASFTAVMKVLTEAENIFARPGRLHKISAGDVLKQLAAKTHLPLEAEYA